LEPLKPLRPVPPLLDVVAEVLVANPSASLAEVAVAAGIGRTTLHKHYATRDELIRAVGHRAVDLWEQAVASVGEHDDAERSLRALIDAMLTVGPQLAFLWRTVAFDHVEEISRRWGAVEDRCLAILVRAQAAGLIAADVPTWWLLPACNSLIYSAKECVRSGYLAPRFATDLVLSTLLRGVGAPQTP
jgi:AcrR family transcriptional regulator